MVKKSSSFPFVSICTPTYNRRPFIPIMFECFKNQTYPKSRIEWIIIDDGTDKIKDLIDDSGIPQIKYFSIHEKMTLGAKRNLCHSKCKGSIIVYIDDDDYYPPERISHAIETLSNNKHAMIAGSSEIYVYFKDLKKMIQFGPYNPNHATAGTFAFRKELLNTCRYEDHASLAEERHFLKNWTIPMVQLDPMKTILVFSHNHNTYDKRALLSNANPTVTKESDKKVKMFIRDTKEEKIKNFFMNDIDHLLKNYAPGEPSMKPDVLKQIKEIDEQRKLQQQQVEPQTIMLQEPGKEPVAIGLGDAVKIVNQQTEQIKQLIAHSQEMEKIIQELQKKIVSLEYTKSFSEPSNKAVSFSEPIKQPSVHELIKQKDCRISELEKQINNMNKKENNQETINITNFSEKKQDNPIQTVIKEKSKLEPEFKIQI